MGTRTPAPTRLPSLPETKRARRSAGASTASAALLLLALGVAAPSCDGGRSSVRTIDTVRETELVDGGLRWNATSTERFRMRFPGPARSEGAADAGADGGLHWETPPGWVELPTSSLRQANFLVAGDERAECYLTILPGDGGGLAANVNRWRKQMSLGPLDAAEIERLPSAELFGAPAVAVDFDGTWSGMSGDEAGAGYRLLGLLQVAGGESRFLKMIGPEAVVSEELDAFLSLAASLHAGHDGHGHGSDAVSATSPPPPAGAASNSGGGLIWIAPEGWTRAPDRAMRIVTYLVGDDEPAECYVALLGGDGGGLLANINRWRRQMGAEALGEAELAELPSVPMLGGSGVVIECSGSFEGMGGETYADALLYGAVRLLGDRSVFVKFVGPRSAVASQRDAFLRFCSSLEISG